MGNYMFARSTRKRTSSEASLDSEVGDDKNIRSRKKYVLEVRTWTWLTTPSAKGQKGKERDAYFIYLVNAKKVISPVFETV